MKKSQAALLLFALFIIGFSACKKSETISSDPGLKLSFSTDTVHFDTIFTSLSSLTLNFKVYNRNNEAVNISSIKLASGDDSFYRININGIPQNEVYDQVLNANDSIYIFVEVTIDPNDQDNPLAVEDNIVFSTNGNEQKVLLLAYGQDAVIYYPQYFPTNGLPAYSIIGDDGSGNCSNVTWTNDKPILIFGYAVVDEGCSLTIEAGTKVYFHAFAGLWIFEDAKFSVLGTPEAVVTFQGDRFEEIYDDEPGQWDRIWINKSNQDHLIQHAVIKNSLIGLQIESQPFELDGGQISPNTITIENTFITHSSARGIYMRNYKVNLNNVAIGNSGQYSIAISGGGEFKFNNCTFSDYWTYNTRETASFTVVNEYVINNVVYQRPITNSYIINSIIDGNISDGNEFVMELSGSGNVFSGDYNLIRTTSTLPANFTNTYPYQSPELIDPWVSNLRPSENAYVLGKANPASATLSDLDGDLRPAAPALGAYEYKP
jgi:hypothetical protein